MVGEGITCVHSSTGFFFETVPKIWLHIIESVCIKSCCAEVDEDFVLICVNFFIIYVREI